MRQVLLLTLLSLGLTSAAAADPKRALTLTYLNIEWFGSHDDEARVPKLQKYFTDNQLWADVMVFEEIVDVPLLKDEVLKGDYECRSYEHNDANHQHVVVCNRNQFAFVKASDDDNFTMENVQMRTLRPAVHGILTDASGNRLLHVFGVHLKAMPDKSDVRRQQVQMIADYVKDRADDEPAVVVGDYNSYADDEAAFSRIFGATMTKVNISAQYTYRTSQYRNKFDLAYASPGISSGISERVVGPCNGGTAAQIEEYNENISDHCPVNLTLRLPNR